VTGIAIRVSDPYSFDTYPDPAFLAEYRSGSNPDPGFWWPKIKKKIYSSKTTIYLSLRLHKGRPSYRRSLQLSKKNIQHFKTWNFIFFSTFAGHFALLDTLTWLNPDPVRIRIGIRSTDHASTHMLCVDKNILFPKFNTFLDFSFFVFSIYSMHRMRAHITFSVQASDLTHRSVSMSDVLGEPFRTPQNVKPFNRYSFLFLTSLSSTVSS